MTTSTKNKTIGDSMLPKKYLLICENTITIPILTKLLAIRIVANNFLGFSSSFIMRLILETSFGFGLSKSNLVKENKAISEPEIRPDKKSRTTIVINPVMDSPVAVLNSINNNLFNESSLVKH